MEVPDFRLADWRVGAAQKRELVRTIVLEAVSGAARINVLLDRVKRAARFEGLPDKDRNSFNVMASQARLIVSEWRDLDETTKARFAAGQIPYSAVYALIRRG